MKHLWSIDSCPSGIQIPFRELWRYRYLLKQFVRKELRLQYRQTLLGPLWFFLQPALSTLTYTFVFTRLARISTDQTPPILFYLSGLCIWNYFSECFSKTCTLLRDHAAILRKQYFPGLIIPLSIVICNLLKFGIQLLLFLLIYAICLLLGMKLTINPSILLVPILLVLMGALGLGMGLLVSALTVRYRDLAFLVAFGTQLLMFVTPVIYPLSSVPQTFQWMIRLNPITAIIEHFRYAFFSNGAYHAYAIGYSAVLIATILFCGLALYIRVEKNFIDSI